MRAWLIAPVLIALACSDPAHTGDTSEADTVESDTSEADTVESDTSDSDTDLPDEPSTDEEWVRQLIAGTADLHQVLQQVSDGGGWPVLTSSGTALFVAEYNGDALFVAGDLNDWQGSAMTATAGFYWAELAVSEPRASAYKLTSDNSTTYWADPWARAYVFDELGEISLVRAGDGAHYQRLHNVTHDGLLPRMVRVSVPAGEGPWPALYVQDGQNLFETGGAFGSWHLERVADSAQMLIVGIDSTDDRMSEYTHTLDSVDGSAVPPLAEDYATLVHDVLRPRIETMWGSNGVHGLMGSSLGGLISLYIAQRDPADWDFVASLSGTLGWGRLEQSGPTIQELYIGSDAVGAFVVYVDSGGSDGGDGCTDVDQDGFVEDDPNDSDNYCTTRAFADALAADGAVWDSTLFHWWQAGAAHNEAAWAARVARPMGIFAALTGD